MLLWFLSYQKQGLSKGKSKTTHSGFCVVILRDLHHLSSPWLPTSTYIGTGQLLGQCEDCELELEAHGVKCLSPVSVRSCGQSPGITKFQPLSFEYGIGINP